MSEIERIGNVFYEVDDMDRAVAYYRDVLGLTLKFQDGGRWAAFDVGGVTLALSAEEPRSRDGATVSLRVGDLDAWAKAAAGRGLEAGEPETGPHERKLTLTDPEGNRIVVYGPLA
jgi:catechol 2,3-dioxygenase-like lactoylglutathione lyase family enzyme